MVSEILNRNANATAKFPAFDWPVSDVRAFFSNDFWAVALLSVFGLMVSLGLAYATLGSGIDLTIGSVPIDMPMQVPPVGN